MANLQTDKLLIIVESPNKVKTIASILKNAGYSNATVIASVGHIMKLADGGPVFNSGIYPDKQFKMNLVVSADKKKITTDIMAQAEKVNKIFLMSDDDREGSVIAWSLIKFCKLPIEKCFRAVAHEITPKAIINAIENPIPFNDNLVNAGFARMMTDKLIGYGLSPIGKKYIGAKSIGRCQSVGLKLISDREKEVLNFIPELYFNLYLNFTKNNDTFKAKYSGYKDELIEKFTKQADVDAVIRNCANSPFITEKIDQIVYKETPKPPFCTATFQQEAANKLGLRVKDAMSCAQKLFEGIKLNGEHRGLITYMRTDSTEVASDFKSELEAFIKNTYGMQAYSGLRKTTKKSSDQEGHEALRVVDLNITPEVLSTAINNELLIKVYRLIWQRTVAAAMPNATITERLYTITNNGHKFKLSFKDLTEAGYKIIYNFKDKPQYNTSEIFNIGETLKNTELEVAKKFTQPKTRYTEASLVKELQQREIGRPSTYATIVETLLNPSRGYAKLEEKYIVPTDRGMQLADYCNRAFPSLINLTYTKNMEETLDKIASGKIELLDYMTNFYKHLQEVINTTDEVGIATEMPEKLCPNCKSPMIVRRSRFGKLFYGCSNYPKCKGIMSID